MLNYLVKKNMNISSKKAYIDSKYGQLHYQVTGIGSPLILCHQSPSSLDMFSNAFQPLAKFGFQVIAIDTPGYGQSDAPKEQPSVTDYASCVSDLINALSLTKVSLLGHHTGASIVAELSTMIPERIEKLILNGPPLLNDEERHTVMSMIEKAPKMIVQKDGAHLMELWERRKNFTPGWTDLDSMHRGIIQMLRVTGDEIHGFKAAFSQDLETVLLSIQVPTMILTNTGDDIYFAAQRASLLRPDFKFTELEKGTHDIVDEQTDNWVESVVEFLQN
ncbi:MAG: hypothetical protein CMD96_05775 [Gammaproteobacteria bacterium]|jgi:pimeloyl-ACP methyl ester carboxylesterase|nr:hypothetical protein [Gammaproteobacteria bacterium]MBQ09279.1 hypothetical protein [Gammaproteobacteria bacterium]HJM09537.1 alpha/beta hydrolase [Gammaproteobacteria bacterium]|tara:strand:- start:22780 stop:23607 length:828 start_codon:yes stop_codon:yes gene_type:complete